MRASIPARTPPGWCRRPISTASRSGSRAGCRRDRSAAHRPIHAPYHAALEAEIERVRQARHGGALRLPLDPLAHPVPVRRACFPTSTSAPQTARPATRGSRRRRWKSARAQKATAASSMAASRAAGPRAITAPGRGDARHPDGACAGHAIWRASNPPFAYSEAKAARAAAPACRSSSTDWPTWPLNART
jgi:hypothetical protein